MTEADQDSPGVRIPPPAIFLGWLLAGFLAQGRDPVPIVPARFLLEARVFGAALLPALVLIRWLVIVREERYLRRKFGRDYEEYSRSVRRWL